MSFENTSDPNSVTSDDVARWCEQLADLVRNNPNLPEKWFSQSLQLHQKIKALCVMTSISTKLEEKSL